MTRGQFAGLNSFLCGFCWGFVICGAMGVWCPFSCDGFGTTAPATNTLDGLGLAKLGRICWVQVFGVRRSREVLSGAATRGKYGCFFDLAAMVHLAASLLVCFRYGAAPEAPAAEAECKMAMGTGFSALRLFVSAFFSGGGPTGLIDAAAFSALRCEASAAHRSNGVLLGDLVIH